MIIRIILIINNNMKIYYSNLIIIRIHLELKILILFDKMKNLLKNKKILMIWNKKI